MNDTHYTGNKNVKVKFTNKKKRKQNNNKKKTNCL